MKEFGLKMWEHTTILNNKLISIIVIIRIYMLILKSHLMHNNVFKDYEYFVAYAQPMGLEKFSIMEGFRKYTVVFVLNFFVLWVCLF